MSSEETREAMLAAIGHQFEPTFFSYSERDVALYALSVGAAADPSEPGELGYVYELNPGGFHCLPTFATIYPLQALEQIGTIPGLKVNLLDVLHGEQYLELERPLPVSGTVRSEAHVHQLYDKGSGALLVIEINSYDEDGRHLALNRAGIFLRGKGGFGGERGTGPAGAPPARLADAIVRETTSADQALFYRLTSGDRNPLHADPRFAALLGFDRPILHGLCTYGFAARAVLGKFAANDAARLRSIRARFTHHVFPGETIVTEMWQTTADEILFRSLAAERNVEVLAQGVVRLNGPAQGKEVPSTAVPRSQAIFAEIAERIAAHPQWLEEVGAVYQFEIDGPEGGSYVVDLLNSPGAARPGEDPTAGCRLAMSYEDFRAMLKGELKPEMAFLSGKLQVSGNVMLALKLGPLFEAR